MIAGELCNFAGMLTCSNRVCSIVLTVRQHMLSLRPSWWCVPRSVYCFEALTDDVLLLGAVSDPNGRTLRGHMCRLVLHLPQGEAVTLWLARMLAVHCECRYFSSAVRGRREDGSNTGSQAARALRNALLRKL